VQANKIGYSGQITGSTASKIHNTVSVNLMVINHYASQKSVSYAATTFHSIAGILHYPAILIFPHCFTGQIGTIKSYNITLQ
jgi:hypothetical protein